MSTFHSMHHATFHTTFHSTFHATFHSMPIMSDPHSTPIMSDPKIFLCFYSDNCSSFRILFLRSISSLRSERLNKTTCTITITTATANTNAEMMSCEY